MKRVLVLLLNLCVIFLFVGYKAKALSLQVDFERTNWDNLKIKTYASQSDIHLSDINYILEDGNGKILYKYKGSEDEYVNIPIPDLEYNNKKLVLNIIVNNINGSFWQYIKPFILPLKKKIILNTSPKKLLANGFINYPTDNNYVQVFYHINYIIKRQKFNDKNIWEEVKSDINLPTTWNIYIGDNKNILCKIPTNTIEGDFLLNSCENYDKFREELYDRLQNDYIVDVKFQPEVLWDGKKILFQPFIKTIKIKSTAEREADVERYAHNAAEQIMNSVGGGQDLRVNIISWKYNSALKQYKINCEIYFNGAIFRSHHYEVDGILTVNEDGSNAKFSRTWVNQRFAELENNLKILAGFGAVIYILNNLNNQ
jgi:hypothetical protein